MKNYFNLYFIFEAAFWHNLNLFGSKYQRNSMNDKMYFQTSPKFFSDIVAINISNRW